MPPLSSKPTVLIGAIGIALVGLVGYNWCYVPVRKQLRVIQDQITQEQLRQRTTAEIDTLLQGIERYRKRLPTEPDPSWLVQQVRPLAERAGVQVAGISQESPRELSQFTRLAVSLEISASYHQLGAFLASVEQADRFIQVEQVQFNAAGAKRSKPLSVTLRFSTLYVSPPSVNPSGTSGGTTGMRPSS